MLFRLLLLFTVVPLIELMLLIRIGQAVGLWPTIGLVVLTGLLGASLARLQGLRTMRRIQEDLAAGTMPADSLLDGLLILVAGAFLVTPGVITDFVGFCLLIPPARRVIKKRLVAYFRNRITIVHQGWDEAPRRHVDSRAYPVDREPPPSKDEQ